MIERIEPTKAGMDKALELHRRCVVADWHSDTLLLHELFGYDMAKRHRNRAPLSPLAWHMDLPRNREAGLDIWGMGLVCSPRSAPKRRMGRILRQLKYLRRVCDERPDEICMVDGAKTLAGGLARGVICAVPGIEGAHAIAGDMDNFHAAYEMGMRYFTLAHFSNNEAACCAMGLGSHRTAHRGLSDFGRRLVDEIHKSKVILDLAHVNKAGFMEACGRSDRPVIVSHTGVCGVRRMWRNIDDEQIEAVAKTGGVVGIIFGPQFLSPIPVGSLSDLVKHILHVVKVAGADHAAYGSDLDGWLMTHPVGFDDITDLPKITALLLDAGQSEDEVKKIIGGNARRVIEEVL